MQLKPTLTALTLVALACTGYAQQLTFSNLNTKVEVDYDLYNKYKEDENFKSSVFYPTELNSKQLWNELMKALESGKVEAYNATDNKTKLTLNEVKKIGNYADTMYVENPDPPYDLQMKVIKRTFNPNNIVEWRFTENMVYDVKKGTLTKQVTHITPLIQAIDPLTGEVRGKQLLVSIKLN